MKWKSQGNVGNDMCDKQFMRLLLFVQEELQIGTKGVSLVVIFSNLVCRYALHNCGPRIRLL